MMKKETKLNKVICVPAYFERVGRNKTVKVPTGKKKKGFFGGEKDVKRKEVQWEQTGWSDCRIDGKRLADDLAKSIETLNQDGYEVVSVTQVTSGAHNWKYEMNSGGTAHNGYGGYGYGYGYSFTDSLIVTAKKIA